MPIERELMGGQSHRYQTTLKEGQFLSVVVEQRGIDVVALLLGPDGKQITELSTESRIQERRTISQVAEIAGNYLLIVEAKQKEAPAGRYEILVSELRAATAKDRALQEVRRLSTEFLGLYRASKYDEAHPLAERILSIREEVLGSEHPDVALSLNNLANIYLNKNDFAKAEQLYQRALSIREKTLGPEHKDVAASLSNLALLFQVKGDLEKAETLYQHALTTWEKALGPDHPEVAKTLNNLGGLHHIKGDFAKAESLWQRALAIREKTLGPEHIEVAEPLHNLGIIYYNKGDYVKAEPLYQRAIAITERSLGPEHHYLASSLDNLALLYYLMGDYEKAEPLFKRALAIGEKTFGPEHPEVSRTLHNLADLYRAKGEYAKAEPLYQRALAIKEKVLGSEHYEVSFPLLSLANLYSDKGDFAKAEPLFQRALAVWEKSLGPEHPDVARCLHNAADLYHAKGNLVKAESLYQRALGILMNAFGKDHPDVAACQGSLAMLYAAKGDIAQAVDFQARADAGSEHNLDLNLALGSERQKLAYLTNLSAQSDWSISLHALYAPHDSTARSLAATTILQRKGRALDEIFNSLGILRRRLDLQDQALLDQLNETNAHLAKLILGGPQGTILEDYRRQIKSLEEEKERLEAVISQRSAEFRARSRPITLEAVQAAIPPDAVLIEFSVYRPFKTKAAGAGEGYQLGSGQVGVRTTTHKPPQPPPAGVNKRYGQPHYVAYILSQRGEVKWKDLGEAKVIDEAIDALRKAMRDPKRRDVKRLARAADEKVLSPLRPLIGNSRHLFVSPDGQLNLIPFAALIDRQGRYLVDRYSFTYLTSGRDLLRMGMRQEADSVMLIVADPEFGSRGVSASTSRRDIVKNTESQPTSPTPNQTTSMINMFFRSLPGTAGEATALKKLLPGAKILTREKATESSLKKVSRPRILHIATHGFFLKDLDLQATNARGFDIFKARARSTDVTPEGLKIENPLLRSGLALAGANSRKSGDEDGILTALEAAGLNLWGTKLVVLSACDTGVGEVKNGEGVYGLRRAFMLAGSETQVMSLWPVSDQGTKDLMAAYYERLVRGEGRGEALRKVQMQMLKSKTRSHPYYWASFIQSGEWGPLDAGK